MTYTKMEINKRGSGVLIMYGEEVGGELTRRVKKREIPYQELSLDNFTFVGRYFGYFNEFAGGNTREGQLYHFEICHVKYVFHEKALRKHRPDIVDAIPPIKEGAIDVASDRVTGEFKQEYFDSF
jgi:hypothetical protein